MPTIYPLARLEFIPDPVCAIVPDDSAPLFLADLDSLAFAAEPTVAFDYTPFNEDLIPVDTAGLFDEDNQKYIFNEDSGKSLFAEEAT
jgi:hypothetical protein